MSILSRIVIVCGIVMGGNWSQQAGAQVTSTWNSTSGNWSDATRWSTNPLFPNNGNGGNDYNAVINGGTVTLDQDIEIEGLTLGSGNINGDFDLTLNELSTWSGTGTMSGAGQTTIGSLGTLSLSAPGSTVYLQRQLVNEGSTTWTAGDLAMTGGTFTNNGSFTADSDANLISYGTGGGGVVHNAGTFTKTGGGFAQFYPNTNSLLFHNTGTVDVQEGDLRLEGGGSHTGDFSIAAGSTLWLARSHSFAPTSDITGAGTVNVFYGTTDFNGQLSAGNTILVSGGTANLNSTTTAGAINIAGGTANLNSTTTVGSLNLSSGTLSGSGNVTFTGASTWSGTGTMSGAGQTTIGSLGTLSLSAPGSTVYLQRQLVNEGSTTWTAGDLAMTGGTFTNNGSFTADSDANLISYGTGGGGVVHNAGTFTKTGGGFAQFYPNTNSLLFHNTGTVDVQEGDLRLEGGGSHTGDFSIAAGSTLWLARSHSFAPTSDITGAGTVNVFYGTTDFNGQLSASAVTISSGGGLKGTGTLQTNLTNSGRLAPGNSPGIITINGNFTQTATSSLEIEVGGLIPGTQHDQVIVTGNASLDGAFEFPIINSFQPQLNDEITFLTANSITGTPSSVFAPNLGDANPSLSFVVIKNSQDLRLRFVAPTDVHFVDNSGLTTQDWNQNSKWDTNSVPGTSDRVELTRSQAPSVQRVEVTTADAVAHEVSIHDQSSPITIAIENGMTLAAAVGDITIGENATIELGTAGNPIDFGTLATSSSGSVVLKDGGILKGNGTVTGGELIVSEGTISPGFSVGHLDIDGNLGLTQDAEVVIEFDGINNFDTIAISGDASLGGTLTVTIPNDGSIEAGDSFEIITAGDTMGTKFDEVLTEGNDDLNIFPIYESDRVSALAADEGDVNPFIPGLGDDDIAAFALALTNPQGYKREFGISAIEVADFNDNHYCDVDDIPRFAELMQISVPQLTYQMQLALAVPEPSGCAIGLLSLACLSIRQQGFSRFARN